MDSAVKILRWAKGIQSNTNHSSRQLILGLLEHAHLTMIVELSHILPLLTFTDLCQRVYFAVDDYSDLDFILANTYLDCIYSEYGMSSGQEAYAKYTQMCRNKFEHGVARLSLLLTPSI
jgi:hypothetical protein